MKYIAGVIRIVLGLAVFAMTGYVYLANQSQMSSDKPIAVDLFGHQFEATAQELMIGFALCGLIGIIFILSGIVTMVRKKSGNPPQSSVPENSQG